MPKEGSKMPKETFFTAISRWRVVSRRARCLGFLAGVAAVGRPRSSATATMQLYFRRRYLVSPGDGVLRKAVQAERQPYSGALLQHLEAQPVGLNELGLHIRHPAYRPDPTIPRRRHRPADQWRSERRRDPYTFRLGCHAPLCLTADAERPPAEEIMSIGGAHGARRGTGPTYLDCPLSRSALSLILQNRISRGSGSPEIKRHRRGRRRARPADCGYPCQKAEASSAGRETTLQREMAVK